MARIDIPAGDGPETDRIWTIDPLLGDPARALRDAIYTENSLPIRVHEAVRYVIADCNQCPSCLALRQEEARNQGVTERFYELALADRESEEFDERERLALEYTHRFCHDHLSIDDALFDRLRAVFTEVELFDLLVTVSRHLGFGRLTAVLQLQATCEIHPPALQS